MADIAARLGRTRDAAMNRARLLGVRHPVVGRPPAPWTPAADAALAAACAETPRPAVAALAARLGRTPFAVRGRVSRLGLGGRNPRPWSAADDERLRGGYVVAGEAVADTAAALGRTPGAVESRVHRLGLARPDWFWEAGQDAALREGLAAGLTLEQLARLTGRTWRSVSSRAHYLGLRPDVAGQARRYAAASGLPPDTHPVAVAFVNVLLEHGPMTWPALQDRVLPHYRSRHCHEQLTALVAKGFVCKVRIGAAVLYVATPPDPPGPAECEG